MTGDNNIVERIIVSSRLMAPLIGDVNEKAINFRKSINESVSQPFLIADIAAKALNTQSADGRRQTYEDTDNRKREFTGDTKPGVESDEFGYRWETAGKWEEGRSLVVSPPYESLNSMDQNPNVGWVEKTTPQFANNTEMIRAVVNKPQIILTKYKVNPKTDDVDPSSAETIDSFSYPSGMSFDKRWSELRKIKDRASGKVEKKILPGRSLASRVPGGSLIARVAAGFGILRDENNKFRCPPGTPAANQFTDAYGTNCFGFSASRFTRFAARKARELEQTGQMSGFRNNVRTFLNFVYRNEWSANVPWSTARIAGNPYYDSITGERIEDPDWRAVDVADGQRLFKNAFVSAQDETKAISARVQDMYERMGIDTSEARREINADLFESIEILRELYNKSGGAQGWDLEVFNVSGPGGGQRLSPQEVNQYVKARLERKPNWNMLTQDEQEVLIKADSKRYYETERAFFTGLIDEFLKNPNAGRTVGRVEYDFFTSDEAGTRAAGVIQDGVNGTRAIIHFNPERILSNQESMLPDLRPDERLAISAIGAMSDVEAKSHVADFLVNSEYAARHMAGLANGPSGFTNHIAKHEFAHAIQVQAFARSIIKQIAENGYINVPSYDRKTGALRGYKRVTSDKQLTGDDIMAMMQESADSININALEQVTKRLEVVEMLGGKYPTQYKDKPEVWALELTAELWALREQRLIFGDDVDEALGFMDDITFRGASEARAFSDLAETEKREDSYFKPIDESVIPEMEDNELAEAAEEAIDRTSEDRRAALRQFKEDFVTQNEREMIKTASVVRARLENAELNLQKISEDIDSQNLDSLPDDERNILQQFNEIAIAAATQERDYYQKMYDDSRIAWRKKYGVGTRAELQRFDDAVERERKSSGLLTEQEISIASRKAKIDEITQNTESLSQKKKLRRIADIEIMAKTKDSGSDEFIDLMTEKDILKSAYIKKAKEDGDSRTAAKISKEIDEETEKLLSPKPKKTRKFKNQNETKTFVKAERARQRRKINKEQADAVSEMGDFSDKPVSLILSASNQPAVGRAVNAKNARLRRLGLEYDPKSSEEGSLDEQVENILIPTMEAIDRSSISETIDIEAVIEFEPKEISGKIVGREINNNSFISGSVEFSRKKAIEISRADVTNKETGKKKRRVVITVEAGSRGIFTSEKAGGKLVIPPGRLRIVGRMDDGSIRAEISYQKDTVEVVDSLVDSIANGDGDVLWRQGSAKRLQAIADKHVTRKRSSGAEMPGPASNDDKQIAETSTDVIDQVQEFGGFFGEGVDEIPTYAQALRQTRLERGNRTASEASRRLSSGADVFGDFQTRAERRSLRNKRTSSNIRELRSILGGRGSKEFAELSRDSLDPRIIKMLTEMSDEEIVEALESSAMRLHSGFDRRVRVRMRESDVEKLAQTGSLRSSIADSENIDSLSPSRRTERLSRISPEARERRLSSGRISTSAQIAERSRQEREVADSAASMFDRVISLGKNIDEMSSEEISNVFGTAVRRSSVRAISEKNKNIYVTNDVPTALTLMSLGHHVRMTNRDLTLTANAQAQLEDAVKRVAARHVEEGNERWANFRSAYEAQVLVDNPTADLSSPAFISKMKKDYVDSYQADLCALYNATENLLCSGHIGIDREKMPQTNGRTSGANTVAIRMLKAGRAKGKWESAASSRIKALKDEIAEAEDGVKAGSIEQSYVDELKKRMDVLRADKERYSMLSVRHPMQDSKSKEKLQEKERQIIDSIENIELQIKDLESIVDPDDEVTKKLLSKRKQLGDSRESLAINRSAQLGPMTREELDWFYKNTNWNDTEVNLEGEFISFLNDSIRTDDGGPAVRKKSISAESYAPSQQQLVASKVDSMSKGIVSKAVEISEDLESSGIMRGTPEFKSEYEKRMGQEWFSSPILATMDGYILDGHHRWAGIIVANRTLDEDLSLNLNVNEVQTDIVEGLTLGKVFQGVYGIKEARLGAERDWETGEIQEISEQEILGISKNLTDEAERLADEIYESGDFIQLGSVGYVANPDYAKRIDQRRSLRSSRNATRRSNPLAESRLMELDEQYARRSASSLSSGKEPEKGTRRTAGLYSRLKRQRMRATMDSENFSSNSDSPSAGMAASNFSKEYFSRIGLPPDMDPNLYPVSGYIVHKSHVEARKNMAVNSGSGNIDADAIFELGDEDVAGDGLIALGEIEVMLKPGVSRRTAYGRGDSISSGYRPVKMNSYNRDDVLDAIINPEGLNRNRESMEAMLHLLAAGYDGDFSKVNAGLDGDGRMSPISKPDPSSRPHTNFEAMILGGFDSDEVEQINYPYSKISEISSDEDISDVVNKKSIAEKLRNAGFTQEEIEYFYSIKGIDSINAPSMARLREYRAAKKVKDKFSSIGFNNVRFAHPTGMNIENPRTYSKGADLSENVETVIRRMIDKEILKDAEEILKKMRNGGSPNLVTRSGARL